MAIYLRDYGGQVDEIRVDDIAADITAGTVAVVQDCIVFYPYAVDVSVKDYAIAVKKCLQAEADKKTGTGEEIAAGDRVYGDPADSYKVSATKGSGYQYLGIAKLAATASGTSVMIAYDGTLHDVL